MDMSQSLLSLMLRHDIDYPDDAILLYFRLLVADILKTRKTATSVTSSWLKIHKPKAIKQPYAIENIENNGPNAKWPIQYGYRQDNRFLIYDQSKQPTT